jgi:hypothetical protein
MLNAATYQEFVSRPFAFFSRTVINLLTKS